MTGREINYSSIFSSSPPFPSSPLFPSSPPCPPLLSFLSSSLSSSPSLSSFPSSASPPQQEDYELVMDEQIAFVMAERVAGHREEEEVGGAIVLYVLY